MTLLHMIIHTQSTNQLYKEIKDISKEIGINTADYEPIKSNRDSLIHSLSPMVLKVARDYCSRHGNKVELNDCISYGFIGAIEATDKYILNYESGNTNTAKLSTYAYSWIMKRLEEYTKKIVPVVSVGERSFKNYLEETKVIQGDEIVQGGNASYFEILNEEETTTEMELTKEEEMFMDLVSGLSHLEKTIIFMSFGIGYESKMNFEQISKLLSKSPIVVKGLYKVGITKMQKNSKGMDISDFKRLF